MRYAQVQVEVQPTTRGSTSGPSSLGNAAALGTLYDARKNTFLPLSLVQKEPPTGCITVTDVPSTVVKFSETDTFQEKFDRLDVPAELQAGYLAGLVEVGGSGGYLSAKRESTHEIQYSLHYSVTTVEEVLSFASPDIKSCLDLSTIDGSPTTHVVSGITWGARCVVTAKSRVSRAQDRSEVAGKLQAQMSQIKIPGLNLSGSARVANEQLELSSKSSFEITVYGDVVAGDGTMPIDIESAQEFMSNIPEYIHSANQGKGKQISYKLMPLALLKMLFFPEIRADVMLRQLKIDCLERFVRLFDDMRQAQQTLHDYQRRLRSLAAAVPADHLIAVAEFVRRARVTESSLVSESGDALTKFRSSEDEASISVIEDLLNKYCDGPNSAQNLCSIVQFTEQMDFMEMITNEGAEYIGYQGPPVDRILSNNHHEDAYIFQFTDQVRRESPLWITSLATLLELIRDKSQEKAILVVDNTAFNTELSKPIISQYRGGRLIVEDVEEQRRILASNCLMRYNRSTVTVIDGKPLQRRRVKVPCPNYHCEKFLRCEWICEMCQCPVEFGFIDDLLYCNCGASRYDQWEFKCKDPRHGAMWAKYDDRLLLRRLEALESFDELNILILGETGVGKSTWINSFVNYLTYDSLEEAMKADMLRWVVPCSFTFTTLDAGQSDEMGKLVQRKIKIGSSPTERDEPGLSATKQTSVYSVTIVNTRVRLIDTPGIGDTGGVIEDNKNMADLLAVLRSYSKLHGILILLKPDASRLTVTFKFCINELLTYLHRDAAANIVFGFTNTRGSNFRPGDTFKPLQILLQEHSHVRMELNQNNVYCFDSESFRYLAAYRQGVEMGFFDDNERSWEHSVKECQRLMTHLEMLRPHEVRSTLNLNEIRCLITNLAGPMAEIQAEIDLSIKVNKETIQQLKHYNFTRQELERRLCIQKMILESLAVDKPRTVCTHEDCIEVQNDVNLSGESTIIYKTICHEPCRLRICPRESTGDPTLRWCSAFSGGFCKRCHHDSLKHMHVYYKYQSKIVEIRDEAVDRDLKENKREIDLKIEAIRVKEQAIKEFNEEYKQLQEAGVHFGFFLKRVAITVYNDSTLEYLGHLIEQERTKIQAGGTRTKLRYLEKAKEEYMEKVKILERAVDSGDTTQLLDDDGIRQLIEKVYSLPHFGGQLRNIMTANERASDLAYRERTLNISAGVHWDRRLRTAAPSLLSCISRVLKNVPKGSFR